MMLESYMNKRECSVMRISRTQEPLSGRQLIQGFDLIQGDHEAQSPSIVVMSTHCSFISRRIRSSFSKYSPYFENDARHRSMNNHLLDYFCKQLNEQDLT